MFRVLFIAYPSVSASNLIAGTPGITEGWSVTPEPPLIKTQNWWRQGVPDRQYQPQGDHV